MILVYILKLDFQVYYTNIKAQKIDDSIFKIFKIVLASFQIKNKLKKTHFFQKTFLLTNLNIKVVLEMLFLNLSNIYI